MNEREWINSVPHNFIYEEVNRIVFLEWVKEFNIEKVYSGIPIWPKMLGRKFQQIKELSEFEEIPYARQQEMYEKFDGSRVLAVHFYEDISPEYIENDVYDFCEERGLCVYWLSYDESWYNPGISLTAVFEIENFDKYVDYINVNKKYDGKLNKHWI